MAIKTQNMKPRMRRGFALLIAIIFASVILAIGTSLGSLGYKQQVLSSSIARSQYAFYAAASALECAMYQVQLKGNNAPYLYDNRNALFPASTRTAASPTCGTPNTESLAAMYQFQEICYNNVPFSCPNLFVTRKRFEVAFPAHNAPNTATVGVDGLLCADVQVYTGPGQPAGTTQVYATGYDVPCDKIANNARVVTRQLTASF